MATATASSDFSAKDMLLYGALAMGAYLLWQMFSGLKSGITGAAGTIATPIANLWVRLTAGAPLNVLGVVQFPDGTQVNIQVLPIRQDNQGNVYTNVAGITYQLQPWVTDASGNNVYPAVAVGT